MDGATKLMCSGVLDDLLILLVFVIAYSIVAGADIWESRMVGPNGCVVVSLILCFSSWCLSLPTQLWRDLGLG